MRATQVLIKKEGVNPTFAINDRIYLGEGLFETLRVNNGKPCFADLHWQRLRKSARILGIAFNVTYDEWYEYLIRQIKQDNLFHGGIKAILSGGVAPRGLGEQGQISQLIIQTFNYNQNRQPIRLKTVPWLRDSANPLYQLKSINYLEAILAHRQVLGQGGDDALFYNLFHHAIETTSANLFLIHDNMLLTPPLNDGVLPGITRSRLLALSLTYHISCQEQSLTKEMIEAADAVIITNSLHGIRSVISLDDHTFSTAHPLIDQLVAWLK